MVRVVNVPMRRILALPFPTPLSKRLMLLYLTGRRSGKSYRQPVSYVKDGDSLLTPGGRNWKPGGPTGPSGFDPESRTDFSLPVHETNQSLAPTAAEAQSDTRVRAPLTLQ
jgi:hypothetical protein